MRIDSKRLSQMTACLLAAAIVLAVWEARARQPRQAAVSSSAEEARRKAPAPDTPKAPLSVSSVQVAKALSEADLGRGPPVSMVEARPAPATGSHAGVRGG